MTKFSNVESNVEIEQMRVKDLSSSQCRLEKIRNNIVNEIMENAVPWFYFEAD